MKRRILLFFVSPWSALDASTRKIQSALVYRVGLRCGRGRNDLEIGLRSMPQNRRITMSEPAKPAAWRPLGQQYHTNNRETTHRNGVTDHCRLVLATYHCLSFYQFRPVCPSIVPNNMPSSKPIVRSSGCAIDCPIHASKRSSYQLPFLGSIRCAIPVHRVKLEPQELCDSCAFGGSSGLSAEVHALPNNAGPSIVPSMVPSVYPHRSLPALNLARRPVPSLLRQTHKSTMMSTYHVPRR